MKTARIMTAALALGGLTATSAAASDWPNKPVTLVVPFRAGGISDIVARQLQPGLAEALGEDVVVLNVAGHSSVGTRRVIDAKPNGYEFLVHETGIMTAEASGTQDFGYRDLKPVAAIAEVCLAIVVRPDSGWKSIQDIDTDAPLIAGVTVGGASHMAAIKAAELGKFDIRPVQVGGTSDAYAALIGNQIDIMVAAPSSAASYYYDESGEKLKNPEAVPLLYLGHERHPSMPDVASMADLGSEDTVCVPNIVFAPKETPDEIVTEMASALEYAYNEYGGLKEFFGNIGGKDLFVSDGELDEFLDNNWAILKPLAAKSVQGD